jgi:hypothetical protein
MCSAEWNIVCNLVCIGISYNTCEFFIVMIVLFIKFLYICVCVGIHPSKTTFIIIGIKTYD